MPKRFMGKFLNILGFEDQEPAPEQPQREDPPAYGGMPARGSTPAYQKPPVRRRIDDSTAPLPSPSSYMTRRAEDARVVPMGGSGSSMSAQPNAAGMRMVVYQPQSYDDTQRIIDDLKSGRPVIANLEDLNVDIAQRVLDFLSGAVYGLDGSIRKVSRGIFLLAPPHVDISGNTLGSLASDLRSGRGSYFNLPRRPE